MTRIAVIDHGAGNLVSIAQGLERSGANVTVATDPPDLAGADGVVLPGVGSTGAAMKRLTASGFVEPLREYEGPLLGICVGLQLLFDTSEEDETACLGLMGGAVRRVEDSPKLPHIGWNDLEHARPDPLFAGIEPDATFYFVHSYAVVPDDPALIVARARYGTAFVAAARDGARVGVQFHPERSGPVGLRVLANFVAHCGRSYRVA